MQIRIHNLFEKRNHVHSQVQTQLPNTGTQKKTECNKRTIARQSERDKERKKERETIACNICAFIYKILKTNKIKML